MLRAILMAGLVALTAIQGGCTSPYARPTHAPDPAEDPAPATVLRGNAAKKPVQAAGEPAEPTPRPAPPLPEEASPPGPQTVYLRITSDSSELEVQLIGP